MYFGSVNFETNEFRTERNNISEQGILDEPDIYTGYLEYGKDGNGQPQSEIEVNKSGMYCMYIAPPNI